MQDGSNQKREPRDESPKGVFDKKEQPVEKENEPLTTVGPAMNVKENFHEPSIHDIEKKAVVQKPPTEDEQYQEQQADAINKAMSGEDLYDDIEIDGDDLKLAEELIFKGYAEREVNMKNFPDRKFTICSTSAEELSIMDEILFDMLKQYETSSGQVDMPQNHLNSMRSAIFLALGYRGVDQKELCEAPAQHLNTIKKAVIKLTELELGGDMEGAEKLRSSLKHALKTRALRVKRLPTSLIDWLSNEKAIFDRKMYKVMSTKNIIPKS